MRAPDCVSRIRCVRERPCCACVWAVVRIEMRATVPGADIEEAARVMTVVGESTGEALTEDELLDFNREIGAEEMKIDDFVEMLIDV